MDDDDIATYIGWKGYTIYKKNISVQEQQMLRKELNVKPFVPKSSLSKPQPFPVYRESKNKIYVPRFYGMEVYGEPDEIRIDDGKKINISFKGELRPKQKPVVKKFMKHIKKKNSGLLALHTGFGKTCLALNIISKIKLKTLIIVHKEFLLRQWIERIEQFLPDAKVGKIQAKTIDTEGKDIVICMLQSLSMKEYPKDMFREYGFSIYDECFPYKTKIHTENGLINIGSLYEEWKNKDVLPKILSFNRITKKFEYKYMSYAWRKERKDLIKIKMSKRVINCTPEHKILTKNGYIEANKLKIGDLIISKYDKTHIDNIISPVLNEDYGYLKVTSVDYFENKGANRCKKPYVYDIEVQDNHNFVIGSDKEYIDGPVVSNCHHLGAEVFSKAFYKVVTKYSLGLSATINRKDGLTKVIKWFLGDVVCKLERKGEDNVLVKVINYETTDEEFNKVALNFRGQVNYTGMIKKICEFNSRSEFILRVLDDLLKGNPNQQVMILAHQKKLLQYLHDAIRHRTIATVGYYVGGMKEKDLKISEGKKVIIATYAMAEEGLDIKSLTTLIMATPKVDVRQSIGRILRQKHNEAVVVDIVDSHSLFQRHFTKRKTFYRKSKFKVIQTNMNGYQNGDWETIYDPINKIKKAFSKTKNEDKLLQGVCLIGN
jgi:superfamily II DNA or RNA helicase